jgi:hypothetical protein
MHVCCFVIYFRYCFEQPLCSSMNRESIWHLKGFINSIAWPYVAPQVFILYFLKNNTSLRQIYFENLRVWENSPISGSNWCLFVSFCIGTWLGEVASKIGKGKGENHWQDAGPDATLLDHGVRFRTSPAHLVTRRWFSGGSLTEPCQCPINWCGHVRSSRRVLCCASGLRLDSIRVRSSLNGCVWSAPGPYWILTGRLYNASD